MEKTFSETDRTNLSKLCQVGDVVREQDMMSTGE